MATVLFPAVLSTITVVVVFVEPCEVEGLLGVGLVGLTEGFDKLLVVVALVVPVVL